MSEEVVADPVQDEVAVRSNPSLDLLRRAAEQGWIADFTGSGKAVPTLTDDQERDRVILQNEPAAKIEAASIREVLIGLAYAGARGGEESASTRGGAAVRLYNVTIVGVLELDDATGPGGSELPRLEFTRCWFQAKEIRMARCRLKSLCLRSCAFTELQASEALIGGPVDLSYARGSGADAEEPEKCWVVLAGAQIGARIHAGHSTFVAPRKRKPDKWVLYSKHAIYALDLRSTRIRGSLNLRPNMTAKGGVCLTLAKVEGSIWANGARLEAVEEWSFAADYAEIQGSLYFRPYDGPVNKIKQSGVPATTANEFNSKGCMSLFAAKIGGSVYFQGAHLIARNLSRKEKNGSQDAQVLAKNWDARSEETFVLDLSTSVINGHCLFRGWIPEPAKTNSALNDKVWHFIGDGEIDLSAAVIRNDLDFRGARVRRIIADSLEVFGNCDLGTYTNSKVKHPQPFVAWHSVSFTGARIRGSLVMDGARIGCRADEATVSLSEIDRTRSLIDQDGRVSSAEERALVNRSQSRIMPSPTRGEDENGFLAAGLTVGGSCSMATFEDATGRSVFRFECAGRISLEDAKIGNYFSMEGARVVRRKEAAINLAGAQIGGKTSFRTKKVEHGPLAGQGLWFSVWGGEIALKLSGAKMAFGLNMNGAYLEGRRLALAADNIDVGGRASLGTFEGNDGRHNRFGFKAKGKVSLVGATIKLQLDLSGAQLERSKEPTRMRKESGVMDALDLTLIRTKGIHLGEHFCMTDSERHSEREGGLKRISKDAEGCGERNDESERRFKADGSVVLKHASIETDLTIKGCTISGELTIDFAKVGGSAYLYDIDMRPSSGGSLLKMSTATRPPGKKDLARNQYNERSLDADISLRGASVGGSLQIWHGRLSAKEPQQMRTANPAEPKIVLDLRGASVGELDDRGGQAWGENVRLWLEGFRYNRFKETSASSPKARFQLRSILNPGYIPARKEDRQGWEHRAAWLQQQYFDGTTPRGRRRGNESTPDAYEQAIAKLKARGSFEDAKRISSIHLRDNGQDSWWSRLLIWIPFRVFFDYGYSVNRALLSFLLCLLLGIGGAYRAAKHGALVTIDKRSARLSGEKLAGCDSGVHRVLYAIHVFIPVLDSKEDGGCSIDPGRDGWLLVQESYAALGWIITPLVILTASGLLKRHLER